MELECDTCGIVRDFPDVLTVKASGDELSGIQWTLELEEEEDALVVAEKYCNNCSEDE